MRMVNKPFRGKKVAMRNSLTGLWESTIEKILITPGRTHNKYAPVYINNCVVISLT
tara:strand:- start:303 stop:470 length:168 start_codon:yes stop_codon:yes gene_type:complete